MRSQTLAVDSVDPGLKPKDSSKLPVSISVTVSTSEGWPGIKTALLTLARTVELAGGELVVTDGSGNPPPAPDDLGATIRWLSHPGESVFELRHRAYEQARGEIVAITEDHVHVPEDWAARMIKAHAQHPEASAIGGSVLNGSPESAMGTASFMLNLAPIAAPIPSGPANALLVGAVNVSYKRPAIEKMRTYYGNGAIDLFHQQDLVERGAVLLNDDSIRVSHVQDVGIAGTAALNYHAGRSVAGLRRDIGIPARLIRIGGTPFLPLARYVRKARILVPKGYGPALLRCTPALLLLLYAHGLGESMGYMLGPGNSPNKLR
jgi:hypothetical protein